MNTVLSFVNPWFLAALVAAGLPVLVHYLTRARPRRIAFPPYRMLREACAGQQTIHQLRQWIILALRCLAVAALVALFSRPFLRAANVADADAVAQRVVIVIDASMSMRATTGGVSLFSRAQADAADLLRRLESGSLAGVIVAGRQPRPVLPSLSRNIAALHQGLAEAQPTMEKADMAAALALAARMTGDAGTVCVFSDFQRSNWETGWAEDRPGIQWLLRPVTRTAVNNVGVTGVRMVPSDPLPGESIDVTVTVFNSAPMTRPVTVRLELPQLTRELGVTVPPFEAREATFAVALTGTGDVAGRVTIGTDDLVEDNARVFVARVRPQRTVLVLSDSESHDHRAAAHFVARAMSPSVAATPGLVVERRHSLDVDRVALEGADAFVVVAPAQIPSEAANIMARRVMDGATLVCFLDGPTAPGLLGVLATASQGAVTPPFQLQIVEGNTTGTGEPLEVGDLARGPLKLFADAAQADLGTLRFRRHYRTQQVAGRDAEVVLRHGDGALALTVSSAGRGVLVCANFPVLPDGGNLAGSPLFPALLHELMRAARQAGQGGEWMPGDPIQVEAEAAGDGTGEFALEADGMSPVPATVVSRGRTVRLSAPGVSATGHVRVRQGDATIGVLAVNADPSESDTRLADVTAMVSGSAGDGKGATARVAVVGSDDELEAAGASRPVWPAVAAVAVAALLLEMLLLGWWRRVPRATGGTA